MLILFKFTFRHVITLSANNNLLERIPSLITFSKIKHFLFTSECTAVVKANR